MEEERKGMRRRRLRGKSSTRQTLDRVLGSIQKPIPTPLTQPREDLLEPKAGRTEVRSTEVSSGCETRARERCERF